jgi:hypothetical protein
MEHIRSQTKLLVIWTLRLKTAECLSETSKKGGLETNAQKTKCYVHVSSTEYFSSEPSVAPQPFRKPKIKTYKN